MQSLRQSQFDAQQLGQQLPRYPLLNRDDSPSFIGDARTFVQQR